MFQSLVDESGPPPNLGTQPFPSASSSTGNSAAHLGMAIARPLLGCLMEEKTVQDFFIVKF